VAVSEASNKELVTLTIDDQSVQAPKGTTILQAAKSVGINIPYYCYHPGLSVVGSCRMCLVEIEKIPKLQPSCATPVGEGMVVRTATPATLANRQSVLEFLLLNHPLDCPVCDQAGECELQNYYMDHGAYDPRFDENKTKRKKAFPIGPYVMLDQERCILCTRCVRFTNEISKTGEIGVHDRGHRSEIDVFPGRQLDNPYSGNVVDICPVGALTDRDFRFQCRVWFLGSTPSVCPGCSRGCNIEIHYNERFNPRYHEKRIQRLKPRFNPNVNGHWICDEGRYGYHAIDAENRLKAPATKQGDRHGEVSWDEAIGRCTGALKEALERHGPQSVAVIASPQMTNEELFLLGKIFRDEIKAASFDYRVPPKVAVTFDDFLITADKNPNSRGAELIGWSGPGTEEILRACADGRIHYLYICHHDLAVGFDPELVRNALEKTEFLVFQGPHDQLTASLADVQLPSAVYAEKEGTFTNLQGRVQRIYAAVTPLGESLPDLEILGRTAAALGISVPSIRAEDIFGIIVQELAPFSGMSYEVLAGSGQLINQA
jgi:NADH-quinone oxidoreductase subunit G